MQHASKYEIIHLKTFFGVITMPRFFIAASNIARGIAYIQNTDFEHIRVLRMKIGERLIVCDGSGNDHICRLSKIGDGSAEAEILETQPSSAEPSVKCTVLAGFPKGERADYLVQKCTEAGAASVVFFLSERCVARPDAKSINKKLDRWQRIAEEAAKQSGRGIIPVVDAVPDFAGALDAAIKTELPLFMYETGDRRSLKDVITSAGSFSSAAVITGPEGGFEPYEAELAARVGIPACSMGPRILRCETAPVIALTALMYATDNL